MVTMTINRNEKFQEIKRYLTTSLNKPVNNANIIEELLDVWKKHRPDFNFFHPKDDPSLLDILVNNHAVTVSVSVCMCVIHNPDIPEWS
jgi:hypothetical protein